MVPPKKSALSKPAKQLVPPSRKILISITKEIALYVRGLTCRISQIPSGLTD
jgi:hypothetical protein